MPDTKLAEHDMSSEEEDMSSEEDARLELHTEGEMMVTEDNDDGDTKYYCVVSTAPAEKQWCAKLHSDTARAPPPLTVRRPSAVARKPH